MKQIALLLLAVLAGCAAPRGTAVSEAKPATHGAKEIALLDTPARNSWQEAAGDAVRSALPFIAREGTAWMEGRVPMQEGSPCVSCHHVGYAVWSHAEARRAGIATADEASNNLTAAAVAFLDQPSIPRAMSAAPVLLAEPARAQVLANHLHSLQNAAGDWSAVGQFPTQHRKIEESDAIATLYTLLALAGDESRASGPEQSDAAARERAMAWLADQPFGESTEWLAARLLLANAHDARDEAAKLRHTLLKQQRQDGGWGWSRDAESEAFSTGQALYALATVGPTSEPAIASGIERSVHYLLTTQGDNGSWQVPSVLVTSAPTENKDQIYRFWGTAWATIALSRALPTATERVAYRQDSAGD